ALVHSVEVALDHLPRDVGPAREQARGPLFEIVLDEETGMAGIYAARLRMYRRDDAPGRTLHNVPDERVADAEAHHQEFVDAKVIEQPELVGGVRIPRLVEIERARRLAAVCVTQVHRDAAVFGLELRHRIERTVGVDDA